jgi:hypothetical protein
MGAPQCWAGRPFESAAETASEVFPSTSDSDPVLVLDRRMFQIPLAEQGVND